MIDRLGQLQLAYWLALPTLLGMLTCLALPAHWLSSDQSSGFALAIVVLSIGGVGQAFVSLFAPRYWAFCLRALLVHLVLILAMVLYGIVRFGDTGPALMALMMPILFPGLASVFFAGLRGTFYLARKTFRRSPS